MWSESHLASYLLYSRGGGGGWRGGGQPGREADLHMVYKLRMGGAILPFPIFLHGMYSDNLPLFVTWESISISDRSCRC
jgi:hypothetical protein